MAAARVSAGIVRGDKTVHNDDTLWSLCNVYDPFIAPF